MLLEAASTYSTIQKKRQSHQTPPRMTRATETPRPETAWELAANSAQKRRPSSGQSSHAEAQSTQTPGGNIAHIIAPVLAPDHLKAKAERIRELNERLRAAGILDQTRRAQMLRVRSASRGRSPAARETPGPRRSEVETQAPDASDMVPGTGEAEADSGGGGGPSAEEDLRAKAVRLQAELQEVESDRLQAVLKREEAALKQEALSRLDRFDERLRAEMEQKVFALLEDKGRELAQCDAFRGEVEGEIESLRSILELLTVRQRELEDAYDHTLAELRNEYAGLVTQYRHRLDAEVARRLQAYRRQQLSVTGGAGLGAGSPPHRGSGAYSLSPPSTSYMTYRLDGTPGSGGRTPSPYDRGRGSGGLVPLPAYISATPGREAFRRSPVDPKGGLAHVGPAATKDQRFKHSATARTGYVLGEKDFQRAPAFKAYGSAHLVTTQSGFLPSSAFRPGVDYS